MNAESSLALICRLRLRGGYLYWSDYYLQEGFGLRVFDPVFGDNWVLESITVAIMAK
jgi:hypothetical protein